MDKRELTFVVPTVIIVGLVWATFCHFVHLPSVISTLIGMGLGAGALVLGFKLHDHWTFPR